jgi:hypothetical protein
VLQLVIVQKLLTLFFIGNSICKNPPPSPKNGILLFTRNQNGTILTGAVAEYQCKQGFQLIGPDKKTCMEKGDWEPLDKVLCTVNGQTKIQMLLNTN